MNDDGASSSLPRRIIDAVAARHTGRKPWVGPLPKPRRSPTMTLGDVQVTFKKSKKKNESSSTGSPSGKRPARVSAPRGLYNKQPVRTGDGSCYGSFPILGLQISKPETFSDPGENHGTNRSASPDQSVGRVLVLTYGSTVVRRPLPNLRKIIPKKPVSWYRKPAATLSHLDERSYAEVLRTPPTMDRRVGQPGKGTASGQGQATSRPPLRSTGAGFSPAPAFPQVPGSAPFLGLRRGTALRPLEWILGWEFSLASRRQQGCSMALLLRRSISHNLALVLVLSPKELRLQVCPWPHKAMFFCLVPSQPSE